MTATEELIRNMLVTATLLPLIGSAVVLFFGKRYMGTKAGWVAAGVMAAAFVCALVALVTWKTSGQTDAIVWELPWIPLPGTDAGWLHLGLLADSLTVALVAMVTFISTLVHVYSIGYMAGDKRFERFFAYLQLFTFSMLGIVTANGLMQLFVFWELVGLTSYLLIGFWYEKPGPRLACKKAFVMNRIGDTGFLIGFGILFYKLGANVLLPAVDHGMFDEISRLVASQGESVTVNPPMWLTIAGIGLFFGAIGKSAQFPLHTWLPDAMEGPTPVSSIIHSATMVAAGVYLTARIYPILTPGAHLFIATIGLITLVMAACMAMVMTDIKRVLAYSTLSQLGYMILGVGVGAYAFALYHLITHAFFKCCLFQCSGSIINANHHQQDMRYYGGLGRKMPKTMLAYGLSTLAISGASIPLLGLAHVNLGLSGFYSKDGIIAGTINYGHALGGWANLFWIGPVVVAYVTVFYMARSFALTFLGKSRAPETYKHVHEAPWTMTTPQLILAVLALLATPLFWPGWLDMIRASAPNVAWVQRAADIETSGGMDATHLYLGYGVSWLVVLALGLWMYKDGFGRAERIVAIPPIKVCHTWALNKFYFDDLYDTLAVGVVKTVAVIAGAFDKHIVDGVVNLVGRLGKVAGWAVGVVDAEIVDGAVNGVATFAKDSGAVLRAAHSGRIRGYVRLLFALAIVVFLVVVVLTRIGKT